MKTLRAPRVLLREDKRRAQGRVKDACGASCGYTLTEKDGTLHLLMEQVDLSAHVRRTVRLFGYADDDRDASGNSHEGTPTPPPFFQVEQVASDSRSCTG